MIRLDEARAYLLERLRLELDPQLVYHSVAHTEDVCRAIEWLADAQQIPGDEILLLRAAALFHDAGFLFTYAGHEAKGAELAAEILPQHGFGSEQIGRIQTSILATKIPQSPQDELGEILCDADLDYLGREDYYLISDTLREELAILRNQQMTETEWLTFQLKFLEGHQYWTEAARRERQPGKEARIAEMKEKLAALSA